MKNGKGNNEYHLNVATMVAILNKHMEYHTDQIVTDVSCTNNAGVPTFIVLLGDRKPVQGGGE